MIHHSSLLLLLLLNLSCSSSNGIIFGGSKTKQSEYRYSLGTLENLTPVCLGTLNFPENIDEASAILNCVPSNTLIDTAEIYGRDKNGNMEAVIGQAIDNLGRRNDLFVATKFAPGPLKFGSQSVVDACKASSERLGVGAIDLYQIHYKDIVQPLKIIGVVNEKDEAYWDGLAECYHAGLAKNVGVCNYGPTMIRRAYESLSKRDVPLVSNQINFNLMRFRSSMETVQVCNDLGIKVLGYRPIASGALTGKYDPTDLSSMPKSQSKARRMQWYLKRNQPLVDCIGKISQQRSKSSAAIAINWTQCKGALPLVGARNVNQATENFTSVGWMLSESEVFELDQASNNSCEFAEGFPLV